MRVVIEALDRYHRRKVTWEVGTCKNEGNLTGPRGPLRARYLPYLKHVDRCSDRPAVLYVGKLFVVSMVHIE